jgi:hypothetical protein
VGKNVASYKFEKRKKEIARQKKQEEKRQRLLQKKQDKLGDIPSTSPDEPPVIHPEGSDLEPIV